jgi:hypothetical protein
LCVNTMNDGVEDWKPVFEEAADMEEIYQAFIQCAFEAQLGSEKFKQTKKSLAKVERVLSDIVGFNLSLLNENFSGSTESTPMPSIVAEATKEVLIATGLFASPTLDFRLYSIDGREKLKYVEGERWTSIKLGSSPNFFVPLSIESFTNEVGFDWILDFKKCLGLEAAKYVLSTVNTQAVHLKNEKLVLVYNRQDKLVSAFTYIIQK